MDEKKRKKRNMLIGIIVVSLLGVVSMILLDNPQLFEIKHDSGKVTSMYSDKLYSYNFYPTDYDLDPTKDERYMQYDRYVYYKNGAVSQAVLEGEEDDYGRAVRFFIDYFDTVIAGDTDTYNTYFTDRYYEDNEPHVRFAPQMLYDIEVEQLSEETHDDGTSKWTFNVTYKIHRNDGTFRNDLDSDSSKTLYFELLGYANGTVKIDYITYYKR